MLSFLASFLVGGGRSAGSVTDGPTNISNPQTGIFFDIPSQGFLILWVFAFVQYEEISAETEASISLAK